MLCRVQKQIGRNVAADGDKVMAWIVKEVWHDGKVAEFGEFERREDAVDFSKNAQMPDAVENISRVEIVEVE